MIPMIIAQDGIPAQNPGKLMYFVRLNCRRNRSGHRAWRSSEPWKEKGNFHEIFSEYVIFGHQSAEREKKERKKKKKEKPRDYQLWQTNSQRIANEIFGP